MKSIDSIAKAATYLGVSQKFIQELIEKGELPCFKAGNKVRIRRGDLRNLFKVINPEDEK